MNHCSSLVEIYNTPWVKCMPSKYRNVFCISGGQWSMSGKRLYCTSSAHPSWPKAQSQDCFLLLNSCFWPWLWKWWAFLWLKLPVLSFSRQKDGFTTYLWKYVNSCQHTTDIWVLRPMTTHPLYQSHDLQTPEWKLDIFNCKSDFIIVAEVKFIPDRYLLHMIFSGERKTQAFNLCVWWLWMGLLENFEKWKLLPPWGYSHSENFRTFLLF